MNRYELAGYDPSDTLRVEPSRPEPLRPDVSYKIRRSASATVLSVLALTSASEGAFGRYAEERLEGMELAAAMGPDPAPIEVGYTGMVTQQEPSVQKPDPVPVPENEPAPEQPELVIADWARTEIASLLPQFEEYWPLYQEAGARTGLHPAILASLHYHEASLDPSRSMWAGELLGSPNPDSEDDEVKPTDRVENYVSAGEHFIYNAQTFYDVTDFSSIEQLKNAFLSWHRGGMYKRAGVPASEAAYVMNGSEDANMFRSAVPGAEPQKWAGTEFKKVGAIVTYQLLREHFGS